MLAAAAVLGARYGEDDVAGAAGPGWHAAKHLADQPAHVFGVALGRLQPALPRLVITDAWDADGEVLLGQETQRAIRLAASAEREELVLTRTPFDPKEAALGVLWQL